MRRMQMVFGSAPSFLDSAPATLVVPCELSELLLEFLDYDPKKRPWLCVHFCQRVLAFVRGAAHVPGDRAEPRKGARPSRMLE